MESKVVRESTPLGNQRSERHTSESSTSDRGRSHHNLRGHVRREEELVLVQPGIASKGRDSGSNTLGVPFPIWSAI